MPFHFVDQPGIVLEIYIGSLCHRETFESLDWGKIGETLNNVQTQSLWGFYGAPEQISEMVLVNVKGDERTILANWMHSVSKTEFTKFIPA